jgi:protein SCO1/2
MKTFTTAIFLALAAANLTLAATTCCSTHSATAAVEPFTDRSIYQVESTWTTDHGKSLPLSQLRGRVQIVTMFFTSCRYACPIIVHDMKKIEAGLAEAGVTNASFVLVTMDTENDTVARLHEFRQRRSLPANWLLLRSEPDDTLELAVLLGVKFKKEADGQFAHSNIITVLNEQGEIVHQQLGLNTDPAALVSAVKNLQKKSS